MTDTAAPSFANLTARIEQGQRRALVRTIVLSIVTVAAAGIVLVYTMNQIEEARTQLATVNALIQAANDAKAKAVAEALTTQAKLKTTQDALNSAEAHAAMLTQRVSALQTQLDAAQNALKEATNLTKYVYPLTWGETKTIFVEFGSAAPILQVISDLRTSVHWGPENTMDGGFTSPGFAQLVLQQMHKLPANGSLASLPHDDGAPKVGDIVTYEGGLALFYFRDHANKEFVIGMTQFGITALTYDFGTKRTGVIRTGFTR